MVQAGNNSDGQLTMMHDEIESHFAMRKQVYQRALTHGNSAEKAALLASVFRNCYFLGCGYSDDVVAASQQFWDPEWVQHYVKLSQS